MAEVPEPGVHEIPAGADVERDRKRREYEQSARTPADRGRFVCECGGCGRSPADWCYPETYYYADGHEPWAYDTNGLDKHLERSIQSEGSPAQVGGDHYSQLKIQPIAYILANDLGYCEGNVVKYVSRWKLKGGVEDLRKARQYLDFLIDAQA